MSETVIKIDLLQHIEISRRTYPTKPVHLNVSIVIVLHSKDVITSN